MVRNLLALGLALFAWAGTGAAQDVIRSERHVFTVGEGLTPSFHQAAEISVRYLSPRSTGLDEFYVGEQYFGPVDNLRAELNGRRLRSDAFQSITPQHEDIFLSNSTLHLIDLPESPEVGDEFRYTYERDYLSPAYAPVLRVPDVDRMGTFEVVVEHPAGTVVEFDVFAPRGEVDYETLAEATRTSIVFRDLEPLDDLPLFAHNGAHAYVLLDIRAGDHALTPTDPDEFASWYASLVNVAEPPPTILHVAEGMRADTDSATIAAFHDYVRQSIRYIADERDAGAFVPRAPDLVLDRTYGDCKDRAFLIAALAESLGLRVDPVLITTMPEPEFDRVHIGLFNHVICAFEQPDGSRTYFDPTDPYSTFGDLPESDVDGHALRMGPDGAERLFVRAQDAEPTLDIAMDVDLDAPDAARAEVTVRGAMLANVRAVEDRHSEQESRNALSSWAGELLYKVRLSGFTLLSDTPRERTYRARADLSEFVIASPTKRYLPLTPFRAVDPDVSDRREDALGIYTASRPTARLRLHVPAASWRPDAIDLAMGETDGPVWFTAHAESGPESASVTYHFDQRTRRFLGTDRDAYLRLAEEYLGARRDVVTFRSPTQE